MTNKPMLSVERDLIERAVQAIINTSQMQPALNELRALLDKPVAQQKYEAAPILKPFRDLPYGTKFRYQGTQDVWVRTQHNVVAAWSGISKNPTFQSLCCFCHLDGDEDGNTLDTLVEVCEPSQHQGGPVAICRLWNEGGSGERTSVEFVGEPCADGALLYAEQPAPVATGTASDKYKAELYDEVWQKARDMGYNNVTDALSETPKKVKK